MDNFTPIDIYNYIISNGLEGDFLSKVMQHKDNYSIAEITDARFKRSPGNLRLFSDAYSLNVKITDEEVSAALLKGLYVSAFISRSGDSRNLHFLINPCTEAEKPGCEDLILERVVRYMIMSTIVTLRLDTPGKVDGYLLPLS